MRINDISKEKNMKGIPMFKEYYLDSKDNPIEFIYTNIEEWNKDNAIVTIDIDIVNRLCDLSRDYSLTSRGGNVYLNDSRTQFVKFREDPLYLHRYIIVHASVNGNEYKGACMSDDVCSVTIMNEKKLNRVR